MWSIKSYPHNTDVLSKSIWGQVHGSHTFKMGVKILMEKMLLCYKKKHKTRGRTFSTSKYLHTMNSLIMNNVLL